jgi:hypothetical protein
MAEKRTIELEIQDNSKSLKSQYKEAVAELQKVSQQYGETSKEAVKAAKAAADLKDQIGFSKDLVDAFNPDAKFTAVTKSIGGVLDGFQAFEGGLALIGVESKDLQETMVRLQAVMALTQGINGVMEAGDSFKQLGVKASDAFAKMTTSSKVFLASGIGLLVVGIGLLIANWDKLTGAMNKQNYAQKALIETSDAYKNAAVQATAVTTKVGVAFEEAKKGVISKDKALKIYNDSLGATFGTATNLNEAERLFIKNSKNYVEASALRAQADALIQMSAEKRIELIFLEASARKIAASGVDLTDEYNIVSITARGILKKSENAKKEIKEIDKLILETSQKASNLEKTFQTIPPAVATGIGNAGADTVKEVVNLKRQIEDEQIKAIADEDQRQQTQLIVDAQRRIEDVNATVATEKQKAALIKAINENLVIDLDKLDAEYYNKQKEGQTTQQKELLDKSKQFAEDKIKLEDEQWYALQKLKNSQQEQELLDLQIAYDKEFEAAKGSFELEKALTDKFNKDSAAINKKYKDEQAVTDKAAADLKISNQAAEDAADLARIQAKTDMALKIAKTFSDVYNSLNGLMNASDNERLKGVEKGSKAEEEIKKRMFKRDKKLRIVQTIIDTASNVVTSVRNGGGIPTGIPFGIAAAAMGSLQIAAISKAKFQGEDGGGGEKPTPPAAMTAQFNTVGNNGINQLAQLQQQPTMAYVVSGQVTSQQALDRNRQQNSSL